MNSYGGLDGFFLKINTVPETLLSPRDSRQAHPIFLDESQVAEAFLIIAIDPRSEGRDVADAQSPVGLNVGHEDLPVPRQFHAGPLPTGKPGHIQPVFQHLGRVFREDS